MPPHPLNPLAWYQSTQQWFSKTETSSGFRAYLIYLIIVIFFGLLMLLCFKGDELIRYFALGIIAIPIAGFAVLYFVKAIFDPSFCRSEKHIENVKRIECAEQSDGRGPVQVSEGSELTDSKAVTLQDTTNKKQLK